MASHYHVGGCVTTSKENKIVPEKIKISLRFLVVNVVKRAFFWVLKTFYIDRIRILIENTESGSEENIQNTTGSASEENIPNPTGSGCATMNLSLILLNFVLFYALWSTATVEKPSLVPFSPFI